MDMQSSNPRGVAGSAGARSKRRTSRRYHPSLGVERFEERTLLSLALVSANAAGTNGGNSGSMLGDPNTSSYGNPGPSTSSLSSNGSVLVFQSDATDLISGVYDSNKAS